MTALVDQLRAALADRYTVERELGRGGMATVYLARDLRQRRRVALKVLHPELAYAVGADRFLREIETAAGSRGRAGSPDIDRCGHAFPSQSLSERVDIQDGEADQPGATRGVVHRLTDGPDQRQEDPTSAPS